jgi:hypothetical protein
LFSLCLNRLFSQPVFPELLITFVRTITYRDEETDRTLGISFGVCRGLEGTDAGSGGG